MKLLETTIGKITVPPGKRDIIVFDDALPGFGIRKFASGKASFFVKYSIGNQQRKITLGAVVPGVLTDMRKKASDVLARARLGQDTAAEKEIACLKKTATIGELVPRFLEARRDELRDSTYAEWSRYLLRYWQPLHASPVEAVTRRDIVARLDIIATEHGRVAADRAKTALSAFFAWLIDQSYLDQTPVTNIKRRNVNGSRERVLSEAELVAVWKAAGHDSDYGRIVRLLILTGQRREEIAALKWSEINLEARMIELPGIRTKNGLPHIVPLSDAALAIIRATPRRLGRDLLFGEGEGPYSGWSRAKARLDHRLPDLAHWTIHDIRRSVVTRLGENGFAPPHVIEMAVNHQSGHKAGVAGTYNKALHLAERIEALDAWAAHITKMVNAARHDVAPEASAA